MFVISVGAQIWLSYQLSKFALWVGIWIQISLYVFNQYNLDLVLDRHASNKYVKESGFRWKYRFRLRIWIQIRS